MAQGIACDKGDGEGADYMITQLADGEVIALCGAHYLAFCQDLAATATSIADDPTEPKPDDDAETDDDVVQAQPDAPFQPEVIQPEAENAGADNPSEAEQEQITAAN